MWGRAFYDDDPKNPILADEYGIVISTSHHEPMMRAHVEWERYGSGPWNYVKNKEVLDHGLIIAVITTREALDRISRYLVINNREVMIKEYPATTIEEEVIRGITAEKDGVKGIICGPIAATTLEKVVNIPVISLRFEENVVLEALQKMMQKLLTGMEAFAVKFAHANILVTLVGFIVLLLWIKALHDCCPVGKP